MYCANCQSEVGTRPEVAQPPPLPEEVDISSLVDKDRPGFTPYPPEAKPDRKANADGKKLCGMCDNKIIGEWRCTYYYKCPEPYATCSYWRAIPRAHRIPPSKLKGLAIPPGVTFSYYGKPQGGAREHQGVITVAMRVREPVIHLGFSFCSPKDPWCKVEGRNLALERLCDDPVVVPYLYFPKQTAREVVAAVALHDWKRLSYAIRPRTFQARVPDWTKKLVGVTMWMKPRFGFLDEAAPVSSETWARLGKVLRERNLTIPKPTAEQILAGMRYDIAKLKGLSPQVKMTALSKLIDRFDPNG